jgi:hypothetical protein
LGSHTFLVHAFQGKRNLLSRLPSLLRGYGHYIIPLDWRIVVLVDDDREDCRALKERLERISQDAGLATKSSAAPGEPFQVLNRLAIEELEAWLLGDLEAVAVAYPRLPANVGHQARFRHPDAIEGGTWEALERLLKKAGYYPGGLPKVEVARRVAQHMDPKRNRSKSFQVFRDGLYALVGSHNEVSSP